MGNEYGWVGFSCKLPERSVYQYSVELLYVCTGLPPSENARTCVNLLKLNSREDETMHNNFIHYMSSRSFSCCC